LPLRATTNFGQFDYFHKENAKCIRVTDNEVHLKETQRQNTSGFQMKVENTSYTMVPKILATADPSIFN